MNVESDLETLNIRPSFPAQILNYTWEEDFLPKPMNEITPVRDLLPRIRQLKENLEQSLRLHPNAPVLFSKVTDLEQNIDRAQDIIGGYNSTYKTAARNVVKKLQGRVPFSVEEILSILAESPGHLVKLEKAAAMLSEPELFESIMTRIVLGRADASDALMKWIGENPGETLDAGMLRTLDPSTFDRAVEECFWLQFQRVTNRPRPKLYRSNYPILITKDESKGSPAQVSSLYKDDGVAHLVLLSVAEPVNEELSGIYSHDEEPHVGKYEILSKSPVPVEPRLINLNVQRGTQSFNITVKMPLAMVSYKVKKIS